MRTHHLLVVALCALILAACGPSAGTGSAPSKPAAGALGGQSGAPAAAAPTAAPAASAPGAAPAGETITFALDWIIFGRHSGFFAALDKGFYAQEGLNVSIVRGFGGADAIKRAASGQAQFVFGDVPYLFVARANEDLMVKTIASVYNRTPHILWFFADRGINSPKDLEGRTLSAPAGDAIRSMFPAFAKAAGIDNSKVNWQTIDPTAKYPLMMSGQAEVSTEFLTALPVLERQAAEVGRTLQIMRFSDYGADLYGNSLMTTDTYIAEKPDVVRRFVAATLRGLEWAFQNPDEAAAILKKYNPEVDPAIARQEVTILQELVVTEETRAHGLGYFSPERMRRNRDLVAAAYTLNRPIEPEEVYTLEFLPRR
jgi:NitT/TauT family transport system substrate-binding protein